MFTHLTGTLHSNANVCKIPYKIIIFPLLHVILIKQKPKAALIIFGGTALATGAEDTVVKKNAFANRTTLACIWTHF